MHAGAEVVLLHCACDSGAPAPDKGSTQRPFPEWAQTKQDAWRLCPREAAFRALETVRSTGTCSRGSMRCSFQPCRKKLTARLQKEEIRAGQRCLVGWVCSKPASSKKDSAPVDALNGLAGENCCTFLSSRLPPRWLQHHRRALRRSSRALVPTATEMTGGMRTGQWRFGARMPHAPPPGPLAV